MDLWYDTISRIFIILPNSARVTGLDSPVESTQSTNPPPFVFPSVGDRGDTVGQAQKTPKLDLTELGKNFFPP